MIEVLKLTRLGGVEGGSLEGSWEVDNASLQIEIGKESCRYGRDIARIEASGWKTREGT